MKKLIYLTVGILLLNCNVLLAQQESPKKYDPKFNSSTNCHTRYFYYPNLEAYFDTKLNLYIYSDKGEWKTAPEIPSGYRGYSLNNRINVPITDYDEDNILQFVSTHKKKYPYVSGHRRPATVLVTD